MASIPYKWLAQSPRAQISEEHRFFFVHIPKCAGTSFDELPQFRQEYRQPRSGHRNLGFFLRTLGDRAEGFRGFTIIRNPWDRLVSAFSYLHANGSGTAREIEVSDKYIKPYSDVNDFVAALAADPSLIDEIGHIKHASFYCDLDLLETETLRRNFMAVKLEDLDDRREDLRRHLRLNALAIQHKRRGSDKESKSPSFTQLSEHSANLIAELYRADMEMFGYSRTDATRSRYIAR